MKGETRTAKVPIDAARWMAHRVAASGKYASGLREIDDTWSMDDVLDANMVLDMLDALHSG